MFDAPRVMADGRCDHCGARCGSGGCPVCTSSRTFCGCGALIRCGCGMTFEHERCPSIYVPAFTSVPMFPSAMTIVQPGATTFLFEASKTH